MGLCNLSSFLGVEQTRHSSKDTNKDSSTDVSILSRDRLVLLPAIVVRENRGEGIPITDRAGQFDVVGQVAGQRPSFDAAAE